MIAFYIVGPSMKTLRNTLFVDLTDSIVEKMVVMTRTATEIEEKVGLKMCFYIFQSFLV
jgi:GTP-dependent phosphoenolpyruvate carboxykinase